MSSPANPDQTPEQGQDRRQDGPPTQPPKRPPANSEPGTPASDDPTRTWWNEPVPPSRPAQPPAAPNDDPTLTQWSAYPPPPDQPRQNRPTGQQGGQQPDQWPPPQYGSKSGQPPAPQYAPQYGQQPVQPAQQHVTEQVVPQVAAPLQKSGRRKARSLFWPGFALGFLLLASLSCGVSAAALGLNRISLDDLRGGTGPAWTPSPITPSPVVVEANPQDQAGTGTGVGLARFAAGQTVRNVTNSRVNVRISPGYLSKATNDVIGQVGPGETIQILGDPTAADDLIWWHVQTTGTGQPLVGWVAEQTASGVQILGASQ